MPSEKFVAALNGQVGNEFGASQQYVAVAVFYDDQTLPRLAAFFYAQALEERNHAMMMIQYLLDSGEQVEIPGVSAPKGAFADIVEPIRIAHQQEQKVTNQISGLAAMAREEGDLASEQFMQWFLKEQVEEVATMSDLLRVVERSHDDPMEIENYIAREHPAAEGDDPTAPHAAGA